MKEKKKPAPTCTPHPSHQNKKVLKTQEGEEILLLLYSFSSWKEVDIHLMNHLSQFLMLLTWDLLMLGVTEGAFLVLPLSLSTRLLAVSLNFFCQLQALTVVNT